MNMSKNKLQRIDVRASKEMKEVLVQAAAIKGISLSSFLLSIAYEYARNLIAETEQIKLNKEERNRFLGLLENQVASKELQVAMKKYLREFHLHKRE